MNLGVLSKFEPGPVALILNEDGIELESTVRHLQNVGFPNIAVLGKSQNLPESVVAVEADLRVGLADTLNPLIEALTGRWIYFGYNAEYLYFPFCEARTISDAAQFVTEERREAVFATLVDLYAADLSANPLGVDLEAPHFDKLGYFNEARFDGPQPIERQVNVLGGLKWRYAEHVPWDRRSVERTCFFRAKSGLRIDDAGVLNDAEMNTYSSQWHNAMTFAVASFRVAKSLLHNPGSLDHIADFRWSQSEPFQWSSEQLMRHGFMEPGQWF